MTSVDARGVRRAREDDVPAMLAIYTPIVTDTHISFETVPPSSAEFVRRLGEHERFPWFVIERGGAVVGYAYAGPFRSRAAYRWSAETSVYVAAAARGAGLARALYGTLLESLQQQGFRTAMAGISLPNPASIALHESLGFRKVGELEAVGYKFDTWYNVGWWQKMLPHPDEPNEGAV